jgi:hypothetical protein
MQTRLSRGRAGLSRNEVRAEGTPFEQGRFDLRKHKMPKGTFTVGGIVYPHSQLKEVFRAFMERQPLPVSKWQSN